MGRGIYMKLFDFANCKDFKSKIDYLASICKENWGKPDGYKSHPVLHNYVKHTFSKLYHDYENAADEDKKNFLIIEPDRYLIFNTGLYDDNWQKVYAYFTQNKNGDALWYLEAFLFLNRKDI